MFAVECVLEQLDNIVADGVLGREAFSPCQDLAPVQSGLLNGKAEGETEWYGGIF